MKKIFTLIFLLIFPLITYSQITAEEMMEICFAKEPEATLVCNAYFDGFLDGFVNGDTVIGWNLPKDKNLSAADIKASFIKFMKKHPVVNNSDIGTITAASLIFNGIAKEK